MDKRWAIRLIAIHLILTLVVLVADESRSWKYWQADLPKLESQPDPVPRWMIVGKAWLTRSPVPSPPDDDWLYGVDYRPPLTIKALYAAELPVALTVGWYQHGLSLTQLPLLPLYLLPGIHRLKLYARILVLETGLTLAIALFWLLVAKVLIRFRAYARWVTVPLWMITLGGLVAAFASTLDASMPLDVVGSLCAIIAFLAWFAFCAATVAFVGVNTVRRIGLRFAPQHIL